jgi:hypothetical protein
MKESAVTEPISKYIPQKQITSFWKLITMLYILTSNKQIHVLKEVITFSGYQFQMQKVEKHNKHKITDHS